VFVDSRVVDAAVNGTAGLVGLLAARLRRLQNGFARSYALTMVLGALLIVAVAALVRMS
jgi:NADH-quinone oxidoreductase subunit L